MTERLIRSTNLRGFDLLVRELGADPAAFRRRFAILSGIEDRDDAFVPFESFNAMLEATATELSCPDLGLRMARAQGLGILGPVAVIARNALTVGDAIVAIAKYLYVHSPALQLELGEPTPAGEMFRYSIRDMPILACRHSYELAMANACRIVRLLSGGVSGPASVSFAHARLGPAESYAETLGCAVFFGSKHCGFVVAQAVLALPIDSADSETRRIATAYLDATYPPRTDSVITERVAVLIRRLLPTGQCSSDAIADQLQVHRRALQRALAEEGTTYGEILEAQRRALAEKYLSEPKLPIAQVAAMLGYAEQSALNRAFRQWFGATPKEFRETRRAERS